MIIAGGTGVLPFLDFFYFMLRKICMQFFKHNNFDVYEKFLNNGFNSKYLEFIENDMLKVSFFGAFENLNEFYGKDIIENLYKISE